MRLEELIAELIDEHGLYNLLLAVSNSCRDKSDIALADELDYLIRDYL